MQKVIDHTFLCNETHSNLIGSNQITCYIAFTNSAFHYFALINSKSVPGHHVQLIIAAENLHSGFNQGLNMKIWIELIIRLKNKTFLFWQWLLIMCELAINCTSVAVEICPRRNYLKAVPQKILSQKSYAISYLLLLLCSSFMSVIHINKHFYWISLYLQYFSWQIGNKQQITWKNMTKVTSNQIT